MATRVGVGKSPPLLGNQANLSKYDTAIGLLDFMSHDMPFSSPGDLTHQDYLKILCYLLIHNTNQVSENLAFDESRLDSVKLK